MTSILAVFCLCLIGFFFYLVSVNSVSTFLCIVDKKFLIVNDDLSCCCFRIYSHVLIIFAVKTSSDFGHAKTGREAKKKWFLGVKFFNLVLSMNEKSLKS